MQWRRPRACAFRNSGTLEWEEPEEENIHIEISVRDKADGRLIPGLDVDLTVIDEEGKESAPQPAVLLPLAASQLRFLLGGRAAPAAVV